MEGTPTDPADVPNQPTASERAAAARAASLRAVFASSPRPGLGPDAAGRAPGETTGSWRIAGTGQPSSGARYFDGAGHFAGGLGDAWPSADPIDGPPRGPATQPPRRRRRRRWLVPFVIVLLVAGGGAAYVALRGNPLHGNPLHGNLFRGNPVRADDRVPTADPTADPTAGEAPDPAPSAEPSVGESAPTGSAPTAAASASLSPTPSPTGRPNPGRTDLALHKKVKSLSDEQPGYPAAAAVDGDLTTRWSSGFSDPQWIRVDLAAVWSVTDIKLHWENAYAKAYRVDVSLDAKHWKTVYRTVTGRGGVRDIPLPPTPARFVRMYGTERNSQYGYSLLEFEVR